MTTEKKKATVAVIGDIHAGHMPASLSAREKETREASRTQALISVCKRIEDIEPDLAVVAGDVFDKYATDPSSFSSLMEVFCRLAKRTRVEMIYGNHDGRDGNPNPSARSWVTILDTAVKRSSDFRPQRDDVQFSPRTRIVFLPGGFKVGLMNYCHTSAFLEEMDRIRKEDPKLDLFVSHGLIDSVLPDFEGKKRALSPGDFKGVARTVVLGDLHKFVEIEGTDDNPPIFYPGLVHFKSVTDQEDGLVSVTITEDEVVTEKEDRKGPVVGEHDPLCEPQGIFEIDLVSPEDDDQSPAPIYNPFGVEREKAEVIGDETGILPCLILPVLEKMDEDEYHKLYPLAFVIRYQSKFKAMFEDMRDAILGLSVKIRDTIKSCFEGPYSSYTAGPFVVFERVSADFVVANKGTRRAVIGEDGHYTMEQAISDRSSDDQTTERCSRLWAGEPVEHVFEEQLSSIEKHELEKEEDKND